MLAVAASERYDPAGQLTQLDAAVLLWKWPAGHTAHAELEPVVDINVPALQSMHRYKPGLD